MLYINISYSNIRTRAGILFYFYTFLRIILLLLLRSLCAVKRTALVTVCNTLCIKCTANDVVTYTGEVTNSSASDKHN